MSRPTPNNASSDGNLSSLILKVVGLIVTAVFKKAVKQGGAAQQSRAGRSIGPTWAPKTQSDSPPNVGTPINGVRPKIPAPVAALIEIAQAQEAEARRLGGDEAAQKVRAGNQRMFGDILDTMAKDSNTAAGKVADNIGGRKR